MALTHDHSEKKACYQQHNNAEINLIQTHPCASAYLLLHGPNQVIISEGIAPLHTAVKQLHVFKMGLLMAETIVSRHTSQLGATLLTDNRLIIIGQ